MSLLGKSLGSVSKKAVSSSCNLVSDLGGIPKVQLANSLFDLEIEYWYKLDNNKINKNMKFGKYAINWLICRGVSHIRSVEIFKMFREIRKKLPLAICVIISGTKVLVVKTVGRDFYELPGGKIMPTEDPLKGAIRELKEETGLLLNAKDVQKIKLNNNNNKLGIRTVYIYRWDLDDPCIIIPPNPYEIVDAKWVELDEGLEIIKGAPGGELAMMSVCLGIDLASEIQ